MSALGDLAEVLRAEGGLLAAATRDPAPGADYGPAAAAPPALGLVLEAIREGYALHYADPRILDTADRDLGLLAGDRLYALGLARLAERGDTEAVVALAGIIAASASAHARGVPADAEEAWRTGTERLADRARPPEDGASEGPGGPGGGV